MTPREHDTIILVEFMLRLKSDQLRGNLLRRQVRILWASGATTWKWLGYPPTAEETADLLRRAQADGAVVHRQDDRGIWRRA